MMPDQARNVGIVFDDEQAWFHVIIVAGKELVATGCQGERIQRLRI